MLVHDYIGATSQLLQSGHDLDTVISHLQSVLARKGHQKLYPRILKGLIEQYEKTIAKRTTSVIVGRTSDSERFKDEIRALLDSIGADDARTTIIDPHIIGGFKLKRAGTMIDRSYKKQLLALYRTLID